MKIEKKIPKIRKIKVMKKCYECDLVVDTEIISVDDFLKREGKRRLKELLSTGKVLFPTWGNVEYKIN